jgi:hypothetical protein
MSMNGWIGVDFDGTLARYDSWEQHGLTPGEPIAPMLARVKAWLRQGAEVRIFTARVWPGEDGNRSDAEEQRAIITAWLQEHLGRVLPVTCMKDFGMVELWDDRAVQIICNTGVRADGGE